MVGVVSCYGRYMWQLRPEGGAPSTSGLPVTSCHTSTHLSMVTDDTDIPTSLTQPPQCQAISPTFTTTLKCISLNEEYYFYTSYPHFVLNLTFSQGTHFIIHHIRLDMLVFA